MMNLNSEIARRLCVSTDSVGLDGIIYRNGEGPRCLYGFWENQSGCEQEMWHNSPFRPLVLTKDLNDEFLWDIRAETGLKPHCSEKVIGNRFYRNLMSWSYLIWAAIVNGELPKCDELIDAVLIDHFNSKPAARINCKKTIGTGKCPDSILREHINIYGDLVRMQIGNIFPNFIFIGGCSGNIILDRIVKPLYPDLICIDKGLWVYYSKEKHTVVVNGVHPSYWIRPQKKYDELREAMNAFIQTPYYNDFISFYGIAPGILTK